MPTTYRIKDWDHRWENAATRKLSRCPDYIPMRTDQRSSVFLRLMQTRDGIAAYGVFVALVQLAASCQPQRGTLARSGVPYDADTCAGLIGADRATFRRAWNRLVAEGWLVDSAALNATDAAGTVAEIRHDDRQDSADDGGNTGGNPPPNPPIPPTVSASASHGFSSRARNGTARHGIETATATARDGNAAAAEVSAKGENSQQPLSDVRRLLLGYGVTPGDRLDAIEASGLTPAEVRAVGDLWRSLKGKGPGVLLSMLDAKALLLADNARRKEAGLSGRDWIATAPIDDLKAAVREYADERGLQINSPQAATTTAQSESFAIWCGERKAVSA